MSKKEVIVNKESTGEDYSDNNIDDDDDDEGDDYE